MRSNYSFEKKKGYLYVVVSGEYEMTDYLSYPKLIREECEKEKIYRVVLDGLGITGFDPSIFDRFLIGKEVANALGSEIKLAAVWQAQYITRFIETVATNRGARVSVFSDLEEAKKWLLNIN